MKINKELLKGSTVILILSLLRRKEMYGYEMIKEMEKSSDGIFEFKEGTLYPILHTLEKERWVEAYWSEHEGRKRKNYRLTEKGKLQLQEKQKEWRIFSGAVERVIGEGNV
ncbi:PadR family transcriptional regulator [Paenibacillus sp. FJAT-26967]|uniref:PadR family transcriptional regulator n=1 Tax=Paenibacillus sp. FJAT-26967 TaxID=1729690 RepID=UPI000838DE65|nr:PadR family transcriptional regulator [Paenibacillus sp. FJAT-26967]